MEMVVIESWNHKGLSKYYTMLWGPYPMAVRDTMLDHFKKTLGADIKLLSYKVSEKVQD